MTRSVNVWFAADKLALRYVCLPVLLVNPVCIVSPMLHTHLVSIQPLSKGKRVNPKTLNKAMHSWISPSIIQNSGLLSHCFSVFVGTVRSPNYKIQPKCSYSFIHGLLKTTHFPFPHPNYKIHPKCSNPFIHGLLKTIHFQFHTQTTKFSPNAQILSSTAYSKQSTSHFHSQTTKFSHNSPILSSAANSKQSAAASLLRFGFESHRRHGCLSVVSVVCCQVEVSATSWSLVQRSPTDCGPSLWVI